MPMCPYVPHPSDYRFGRCESCGRECWETTVWTYRGPYLGSPCCEAPVIPQRGSDADDQARADPQD
jgi:hypothetical protein